MQIIHSIKHEKIELARAVKTRKGRQETGRILLEGEEVLGKLWFTIEATESKILSGFSSEEVVVLKKWLKQIQDNSIEMFNRS